LLDNLTENSEKFLSWQKIQRTFSDSQECMKIII
jgi:hypothetical protein